MHSGSMPADCTREANAHACHDVLRHFLNNPVLGYALFGSGGMDKAS